MDEQRLRAPEFVTELADRFEERQAFDVADGAADLGEDEVDAVVAGGDELFDLVGDVGNDLHGPALIVAAPFALDDAAVDRPVVMLSARLAGNAREALVMTEVEVGLRAVVGHKDLAVLDRRHRPRIDVEIRVELPKTDRESTRLEQRCKRR